MQIKNENFTDHINLTSFYEKKYREDGLIESFCQGDFYTQFEYNDVGKIIIENLSESVRRVDIWEVFYKSEYKYDNLITRIFKYKTGFTKESNLIPDFNSYGEQVENTEVIYALNELIFLKEILKNERGDLAVIKETDLKRNSISEKKYTYDDFGNLTNEIWLKNNEKICDIDYNYKENTLEFISIGNVKKYYKYNLEGKIVEISWFDLISEVEDLYATINFEYIDGKCKNIIFNASESRYLLYDELHFWTWKIEAMNNFALDINYWLNCNYDYCYSKNYEIKIEYNSSNEVKQTTLYSRASNKIEEIRFFIYEYDENIKTNSGNYLFNNSHPLEYIAGFSIVNNQIEHLFSHKFEYFKNDK